jgi:CHAT domain-containing protein
VFDPLALSPDECPRLVLAPDGELAVLPFDALPTDECGHLIDRFTITYVGAGRDVLRFGAPSERDHGAAVVAADPDFDLGNPAAAGGKERAEKPGLWARLFGWFRKPAEQPVTGKGNGPRRFERLPGTLAEGERVAALLGVQPLLGTEVRRGKLVGKRPPRVLHLATPALFVEAAQPLPVQGPAAKTTDVPGRLEQMARESPLQRAGLALAGANAWLASPGPASAGEQGILTARDITGIDWSGTELVVLSAAGPAAEGLPSRLNVIALRRAFLLAGARALVTCQWHVADAPRLELLEEFYRRFLAGQGCADALREARLALKARGVGAGVWGAFVGHGDPGWGRDGG